MQVMRIGAVFGHGQRRRTGERVHVARADRALLLALGAALERKPINIKKKPINNSYWFYESALLAAPGSWRRGLKS